MTVSDWYHSVMTIDTIQMSLSILSDWYYSVMTIDTIQISLSIFLEVSDILLTSSYAKCVFECLNVINQRPE